MQVRWDDITPIPPRDVTRIEDLHRLTPANIDEALECMHVGLRLFHAADDHRAVFLRCYAVISSNLRDALAVEPPFTDQLFFEPEWVNRLSGRFATLYFRSLLTDTKPSHVERAWKIAHRNAIEKRLGVTQEVLLGINAHINYDLPLAIYQTLIEYDDHTNAGACWLHRRKFDHDQVNNVLMRSIPEVQATLSRTYGGLLGVLGHGFITLDDLMAETGLKYYRERVWWDALSFLAARRQDDSLPALPRDPEFEIVQRKLDWESAKLAEGIRDAIGPLAHVAALARKPKLGPFEPE